MEESACERGHHLRSVVEVTLAAQQLTKTPYSLFPEQLCARRLVEVCGGWWMSGYDRECVKGDR